MEIVAAVSPGSGQDITARTIQKVLQEKKLVATPVSVLNKPGGGGSVGWAYISQHPADPHYLSVIVMNLLTNEISGRSPLRYTDFTPFSQLGAEYIVLAVKPESPFKTGADFVARLKKEPESVSIGLSTALANAPHIAVAQIGRTAGIDVRRLKIVVFNSAAEARTSLLGGHIDMVSASASNVAAMMQSGQLRALGVSAPRRVGGALAAIPTWREQGVDAVFTNWRAVVAPRGLSAAQIAFWDAALLRLTQSDDWNKDLEANYAENVYTTSEETRKFLAAQFDELKVILANLGLTRQ